jgi:L-threonylcarbamoyladenylate synthase
MNGGTVGTSIERALEVVGNGGLVALPTETVYGLAADASNEAAVRRVFAAKGRPADHPLIVHVATPEQLARWAAAIPDAAATLAATCWPGPLTVLVPKAAHVLSVVTGGRDTVGVRVPAHPMACELLTRFGGGLAAPSANRFGKVSPTTAAHVAADLGSDVDYILDGGHCPVGVESTIVDCTTAPPQILRPGAITAEQVSALLHSELAPAAGLSRAAGMLASHYAPLARVLLVENTAAGLAATVGRDDTWLLDHSDDLVTYAHRLYDDLRAADLRGVRTIVAVLPPPVGLGHAIRDRLLKAAAQA